MDIIAALRQEEAKFEKEVSAAQQQLDTVRAAMKLLGGMNSNGKTTASSNGKVTASSSGKTTGEKKRVMSAAARAKISKATKERWAKFRAAKAKGKK
jgi:hypothetical protein